MTRAIDRALEGADLPMPHNPAGPHMCRVRVWNGEELPGEHPEGWCNRPAAIKRGKGHRSVCAAHAKRMERGKDMRVPIGRLRQEVSSV